MKTARTVCTLALSLLLACPVLAAGKKNAPAKEGGIPYFKTMDQNLKPITLTEEQKAKVEALKKEYEQKLKDAYAKQNAITPEQKKAGEEAKKTAAAAGKKGKELSAAVDAAINKTADQKAQESAARKELSAIQKEIREKIDGLLTAEQKTQLKAAKSKKPEKPAKPAAKPAKEATK